MFKKLTDDARLPERATKYSAGFDVFANEDVIIGAGETALVGLGVALDMDIEYYQSWAYNFFLNGESTYIQGMDNFEEFLQSYYFELHPRSSLRAKGIGGGVGIIDIDYRDEIKMVVTNPFTGFDDDANPTGATGWYDYKIKKGDKIGQLLLKRHEGWMLPSEYTKNEERNGGFGSTGE